MALELKILVDDAGQLGVSGPLENKLVVYGLLLAGFETLIEHYKQKQSLIQPATMLPPNPFNRTQN